MTLADLTNLAIDIALALKKYDIIPDERIVHFIRRELM